MKAFIKYVGSTLVVCIHLTVYPMEQASPKFLATKKVRDGWLGVTMAKEIVYNPNDSHGTLSAYILKLSKRDPNLKEFLEKNINILLVSPKTIHPIDYSIIHLEQPRCTIL